MVWSTVWRTHVRWPLRARRYRVIVAAEVEVEVNGLVGSEAAAVDRDMVFGLASVSVMTVALYGLTVVNAVFTSKFCPSPYAGCAMY